MFTPGRPCMLTPQVLNAAALPLPLSLGLPIGQHISFKALDSEGKDVYRSYTPVSDDKQRGWVDFVIKIYPQVGGGRGGGQGRGGGVVSGQEKCRVQGRRGQGAGGSRAGCRVRPCCRPLRCPRVQEMSDIPMVWQNWCDSCDKRSSLHCMM